MATPAFTPGRASLPASQVEISIACKQLHDRDAFSKSDPMAVLLMKDFKSQRFIEIGRTEMIKNSLNPEFCKKFLVDYYFEEAQTIKVEIYDVDSPSSVLNAHDFLGRVECTLGEIVGAPGGKIHRFLTGMPTHLQTSTQSKSSCILSAEELSASKEVAYMQWKGLKLDKKDFLGKSDPFLQIYRLMPDGSAKLVYRTEHIDNTLNPVWKPFRIRVQQLCGDNPDRTLRFECYDWDSDGGQAHDLIGSFETTYRALSQNTGSLKTFDLINPKKKAKKKDYKNSGQLQLAQFTVETEHTFLEFVRGGTQLHFTVAVDFTASNGHPRDPASLHYIHPQYPNQYMIALKAIGEIIQDYDVDKMFPALGFGAKLPPGGVVSHEFYMNFTQDPHCHGVGGILDAYRRAVNSVELYGPTNFSPVINHVAKFASNARDGLHYFVLLIITDGAITDVDNTIASIVNASSLPMSVIIVGVGNADFSAMEMLDADKNRLQIGGRVAQRDIVQFVALRDYIINSHFDLSQARLAKDVLAEVPQQLIGFMKTHNIKPRPPQQANIAEPTAGMPPPSGGGEPGAPGQPPPAAGTHVPTAGPGGPPPPAGAPGAYPPLGGQGQPQSGYPQASAGSAPYPSSNPAAGTYPPGNPGASPYPTGAGTGAAGPYPGYPGQGQAGAAGYPYGGAAPPPGQQPYGGAGQPYGGAAPSPGQQPYGAPGYGAPQQWQQGPPGAGQPQQQYQQGGYPPMGYPSGGGYPPQGQYPQAAPPGYAPYGQPPYQQR